VKKKSFEVMQFHASINCSSNSSSQSVIILRQRWRHDLRCM